MTTLPAHPEPVEGQIIALIQRELDRTRFPHKQPVVTADSDLVTDLRCCAVDYQCIAMELDEVFDIEIPDRVLDEDSPDQWRTPANIAATVRALLTPSPAGERP